MIKWCPICSIPMQEAVDQMFGDCCSQECARTKATVDALKEIARWLQGLGLHLTGEMVSFYQETPAP